MVRNLKTVLWCCLQFYLDASEVTLNLVIDSPSAHSFLDPLLLLDWEVPGFFPQGLRPG